MPIRPNAIKPIVKLSVRVRLWGLFVVLENFSVSTTTGRFRCWAVFLPFGLGEFCLVGSGFGSMMLFSVLVSSLLDGYIDNGLG